MPYQTTVAYATFFSVDNIEPVHVTESWETFVSRMRNVQAVESKAGIGLFCGSTFPNGSGRRNRASVGHVSMLVIDVDNSVPVRDDKGNIIRDADNKMVKALIPNPVYPDLIEAMLTGYEYVVATSHSHSAAWPRFRVVLPLATAVPGDLWEVYADEALRVLGLDIFRAHIDSQLFNPSQSYYWPSCPPGAAHHFHHAEGKPLTVVLTAEAITASAASVGRRANKHSPFTPEQVERYYRRQLPDLNVGETVDGEWRHVCPLHGGRNPKFYINMTTGFFKCWTKCSAVYGEGKTGGDIYRFHERRYNLSFPDAKKAVHEIIGGEPGGTMTDTQVAEAIPTSTVAQVPLLMEEVKHQPPKVANKLIAQLVTTHPELRQEDLKADYQADRKVLSFNQRSEEATAADQIKAEVAQVLEAGVVDEFGLCLAPDRYELRHEGVFEKKVMSREGGSYLTLVTPPITERPVWPAMIGHDLATDKLWIDLQWVGSKGQHHSEWLPTTSLNSREAMMNLNDSPLSIDNVIDVCRFLRFAKTAIKAPTKNITSAVGWVGKGGARRFVMPGDSTVEYVGPPMEHAGTVAAWAHGLAALAAAGPLAFKTLACVGLSASSPLVRHTNRRNPVIGLVADSSTGKGMSIQYAMSIWTEPRVSTVPAMSSVKGTQDIGMNRPDYPIFVDEVQQLYKRDPQMVEDLVYFMGNGQRRIVATRTGGTRGGERRYGASLWAAEDDVTQALQRGAQNRVVVLHGSPLPNAEIATVLSHIASYNYGVVGAKIGDVLNENLDDYLMEVEITAMELSKNRQGLVGDDPYTIAFVQQGLQLLQDVTGVVLPIKEIVLWLIRTLNTSRGESKDYAEETFVYLLETLMSAHWGKGGAAEVNCLADLDSYAAFRLDECCDPESTPFEINPTSNRVVTALKHRGYNERIASVWLTRGWIKKQGKNMKWTRGGTRTGAGVMVWRVTKEGLAQLGMNLALEGVENAVTGPG